MNPRILIGGIGNVLLGDDAVGPYAVRLLESEYSFGDNVEIADLGTPALDLTHRIVGLGASNFGRLHCSQRLSARHHSAFPQRRYSPRAARAASRPPCSRLVRVPHDCRNARREPERLAADRNSRRML